MMWHTRLMRIPEILLPLAAIIIVCGMATHAQDASFEIPWAAFKLLADSTVETCPLCVTQDRRKAFAILSKEFMVGRRITGDSACGFVKTKECGANEIMLACYKGREFYRDVPEKGKAYFPLLKFKSHTDGDHLVGIQKEDYTDSSVAAMLAGATPDEDFEGEITIIPFAYGDGPAYKYNATENTLVVQCKIIRLNKKK